MARENKDLDQGSGVSPDETSTMAETVAEIRANATKIAADAARAHADAKIVAGKAAEVRQQANNLAHDVRTASPHQALSFKPHEGGAEGHVGGSTAEPAGASESDRTAPSSTGGHVVSDDGKRVGRLGELSFEDQEAVGR